LRLRQTGANSALELFLCSSIQAQSRRLESSRSSGLPENACGTRGLLIDDSECEMHGLIMQGHVKREAVLF
jgi:hypothetical protein